MEDLFLSKTNVDLVFNPPSKISTLLYGNKNQSLTAHSDVISIRCPKLMENSKSKKGVTIVKYEDTHSILPFIIQYCYVNYIDFEKISLQTLEKIHASCELLELFHLRYLCEHYIAVDCVSRNVTAIHQLMVISRESRNIRLQTVLLTVVVKNFNSFISSKDGIYLMGIEYFPAVCAEVQEPHIANSDLEIVEDTLQDDYLKMKISQIRIKSARK